MPPQDNQQNGAQPTEPNPPQSPTPPNTSELPTQPPNPQAQPGATTQPPMNNPADAPMQTLPSPAPQPNPTMPPQSPSPMPDSQPNPTIPPQPQQTPTMPAQSMQQPPAQPGVTNPSMNQPINNGPVAGGTMNRPDNNKKIVKILAIAVGGLVVVGFVFGFVMALIGGLSVPDYSTLEEASLEGYSEDSGMTYKVPADFTEATKTDLSAEYYAYKDPEVEDRDNVYAEQSVGVQSLFSGGLSKAERNEFLAELSEQASGEDGIISGFSDVQEITDVEVVAEESNTDDSSYEIELAFNYDRGDDGLVPGRLKARFIIGDGYLYLIGIAGLEEVWDANADTFNEIIDSVEVDQ